MISFVKVSIGAFITPNVTDNLKNHLQVRVVMANL